MPTEGTIVDEALEEILVALGNFEPLLEGLRDYARLNIKPETLIVINAAIQEHERRMALLANARDMLQALLDDGYPLLETHEVGQLVFEDLQNQLESITAAAGHFDLREPAGNLGLVGGEPEPKA